MIYPLVEPFAAGILITLVTLVNGAVKVKGASKSVIALPAAVPKFLCAKTSTPIDKPNAVLAAIALPVPVPPFVIESNPAILLAFTPLIFESSTAPFAILEVVIAFKATVGKSAFPDKSPASFNFPFMLDVASGDPDT